MVGLRERIRKGIKSLKKDLDENGRWVIEDPAVMYVRECFAYVLL